MKEKYAMRSSLRVLTSGLFGIVLICCVQATVVNGDGQDTRSDAIKPELKKTMEFDLGGGVKMDMVLIQPGSFMMGDRTGEKEEKPAHKVTISRPFYMGKFEVTQEQWKTVMNGNPSHFKGAKNPADNISWEASQEFVKKLNEKFGNSGVTFSLPTEAQWEYACRAGTSTRYGYGNEEAGLEEYGWFKSTAGGKTHPVGEKKPNAWGLYDMHGNVWEWCADWYDGNYYKQSPSNDPAGPADPKGESGVASRVLRGGSWGDPAFYCRSAYRHCLPPWFCVYSYGFRGVCS